MYFRIIFDVIFLLLLCFLQINEVLMLNVFDVDEVIVFSKGLKYAKKHALARLNYSARKVLSIYMFVFFFINKTDKLQVWASFTFRFRMNERNRD